MILILADILPDTEAGTCTTGDEPNQREMKLRFWKAGAPEEVEDWRCSGDWADGLESRVGVAATLTTVEGVGGEEADINGDWGGIGGWGVLGLELPVEAPLGGTIGDWDPEEGLWPLAGQGEP